jgi:adenine deaminase
MDDVTTITAEQAKIVAEQLKPISEYLSKLLKRIRDLGYDDSTPLLQEAFAASTRVAFLRITFEGMHDPERGNENRVAAAKPKNRVKPMGA